MFIRSIFLSLDRKYVLQSSPKVKSLWDMGLSLFCLHVITLPDIEEKVNSGYASGIHCLFFCVIFVNLFISLISLQSNFFCLFTSYFASLYSYLNSVSSSILTARLLRVIEQDRRDEDVDKRLLKHVIRMLSALRLYPTFEKAFLLATSAFYQAEADRLYAELPVCPIVVFFYNRFYFVIYCYFQ